MVGHAPFGPPPRARHRTRQKPYDAHVDLAPQGSRTIDVKLVDEPAGSDVPTWIWITGGAVLAGGAAVSG